MKKKMKKKRGKNENEIANRQQAGYKGETKKDRARNQPREKRKTENKLIATVLEMQEGRNKERLRMRNAEEYKQILY